MRLEKRQGKKTALDQLLDKGVTPAHHDNLKLAMEKGSKVVHVGEDYGEHGQFALVDSPDSICTEMRVEKINKDGKDPYRSAHQTAFSTRQFKPQSGRVRRRRSRRIQPQYKAADPDKFNAVLKAQQEEIDKLDERMEKLTMSYDQDEATEFRDSKPMSKEELAKLRESPDRVVSVDSRSVFQAPDQRFEKAEDDFRKSDFFSKVAEIKKNEKMSEVRAMQEARKRHPDLYEAARAG